MWDRDKFCEEKLKKGPTTSWQIEGEKVEAETEFLFLALNSPWMVAAAMKSEDDCFLAGKQWQN